MTTAAAPPTQTTDASLAGLLVFQTGDTPFRSCVGHVRSTRSNMNFGRSIVAKCYVMPSVRCTALSQG